MRSFNFFKKFGISLYNFEKCAKIYGKSKEKDIKIN